jgi:hypothetical protein
VCADEKRDSQHRIVVEADWQTSDAKYVGWSEKIRKAINIVALLEMICKPQMSGVTTRVKIQKAVWFQKLTERRKLLKMMCTLMREKMVDVRCGFNLTTRRKLSKMMCVLTRKETIDIALWLKLIGKPQVPSMLAGVGG